jgi:hypothetical protein
MDPVTSRNLDAGFRLFRRLKPAQSLGEVGHEDYNNEEE